MAGVGFIVEMLRAFEVREIQAGGIDRPVGIIRAQQDEFGNLQPVEIFERVHEFAQRITFLRCQALRDLQSNVVANLLAELTVGFQLLAHLRAKVQHINHRRRDADHTLIYRRGEPGGPSPFRRTKDDELLDRPAEFVLRVGLRRVHRAHGALDHGQQQRPVRLAGLHVLIERMGDDAVLILAVEQWLIGHLLQHGQDSAGFGGEDGHDRRFPAVGARGVVVPIGPAADKQNRLVTVLDLRRNDQCQPVLPLSALPRLRGQAKEVRLAHADLHRRMKLEFVTVVRLINKSLQVRTTERGEKENRKRKHDQTG